MIWLVIAWVFALILCQVGLLLLSQDIMQESIEEALKEQDQ